MGKSVLNAVRTGTTHSVMTVFDMTAYVSNRSVARSRTAQEKNQQHHQRSFK
jgi:hypothetical protein